MDALRNEINGSAQRTAEPNRRVGKKDPRARELLKGGAVARAPLLEGLTRTGNPPLSSLAPDFRESYS